MKKKTHDWIEETCPICQHDRLATVDVSCPDKHNYPPNLSCAVLHFGHWCPNCGYTFGDGELNIIRRIQSLKKIGVKKLTEEAKDELISLQEKLLMYHMNTKDWMGK